MILAGAGSDPRHARIPADFRPYLTATPRILAAPQPQRGADGEELEIASMRSDPEGPYGEWTFELGLSESIERGILAGFEIDVLEIRDPQPVLGGSEEAVRGRRLALLQTALLEHAARWNLKTVMTFHQRAEELPCSRTSSRRRLQSCTSTTPQTRT
jgi:hypothetical protein